MHVHLLLPPNQVRLYVGVLVSYLAVYLAVAIGIGAVFDSTYHAEFLQDGIVSAMSAIFLSMASAFALASFLVHPGQNSLQRWCWMLIAAGLLFLTLGQLFQFHEQLGLYIGRDDHTIVSDVIIAIYGGIGLAMGVVFFKELVRYRTGFKALIVGFAFFLIHTGVEFASHAMDSHTMVPEIIVIAESAKLFAVSFFALGMLFVLLELVLLRTKTNG